MGHIETSRPMRHWKDAAAGWRNWKIRYADGTSEWMVGTRDDANWWCETHATASID